MATTFRKLNDGWNAEPNAPDEGVHTDGDTLVLEFVVNPWMYPAFVEGEKGRLTFTGCQRYRFTDVNDEAWFNGQCRYSRLAPTWGEFYEVSGNLLDQVVSDVWITLPSRSDAERHRYLFYLRDRTFECDAQTWRFEAKTKDGKCFAVRPP